MPFFGRAALDLASVPGSLNWRWLLVGAGAQAWLTDVLGGFAEVDLGIPLRSAVGLPILLRAGVSIRL